MTHPARLTLSLSTLALSATLALMALMAPWSAAQDAHTADPVRPQRVLEDMAWLAGSWSGDMWGGRFHAYYSTPEGGKILSHSKLMRGGEQASYEFEVFEAREDAVILQPFPGGSPADGFQLQGHDPAARRAVFENPDKDYPTRIVYERIAEDELLITLSDPHGTSEKTERFELQR